MNEFSVKLYASGNLIGEFDDLKSAVDFANEDTGTAFTIDLAEGDVDIGGAQVVIRKDITIAGAGMDATTLHADFKTGGNHNVDSAGLILVMAGVTADFSDLKIDGSGQQVTQAIRHLGIGTVEHVHFANIGYSTYVGTGISVRGDGDVDVLNSTFTNIARIGAHFRDEGVTGKFEGNTYKGKGGGDRSRLCGGSRWWCHRRVHQQHRQQQPGNRGRRLDLGSLRGDDLFRTGHAGHLRR